MSNPYQTPNTSTVAPVRVENTRPRWLDWLFWGVALIPAASVYFTWLVAWLTLGHPPRPLLDDPKHISTAVSTVYFISLWAVIALASSSRDCWPDSTVGSCWPLAPNSGALRAHFIFRFNGHYFSLAVGSVRCGVLVF